MKSPGPDRLDLLAREDKWYLAGGDGVLWAPPFPAWLHTPGFWDECTIYCHELAPLFSVAAIDEKGQDIPLRRESSRWTPRGLDVEWRASGGDVLVESRTVRPRGRFVSRWSRKTGDLPLTLAAFTAQPGEHTSEVGSAGTGISWVRRVLDRREAPLDVQVRLSASPACLGAGSLRADACAVQPRWDLTPFSECWNAGRLAGVQDQGVSRRGLLYACVTGALESGGPVLTFEAELTPRGDFVGAIPPPQGTIEDFYDRFPKFECSEPFLQRYYDYRIWGLYLNRLEGGFGNVRHPAIAEGIAYFHVPITYSAQCHMLETRWARDPAEARGSIRNFLHTQKGDGSFHGRIYSNHLRQTDFYHANWGEAVLAVDEVAPDREFIAECYDGLERYDAWMDGSRDPQGTGMYDVVDQFETGQEYMSRYLAVDRDADRYGWENRIRLKGVDVTVYQYQLKRALAEMARRLEKPGPAVEFDRAADRVGSAIQSSMWDPDLGLYTDVTPDTLERTRIRAAVSFYPLLTDLPDEQQVLGMLALLEDPTSFGTPFPVPSSAVDDAQFDPNALWKGKRHNCPWNGRVWPMTNSHIVHGLIRQWRLGHRAVGPAAGRLLRRFVHLLFHDGDLERPNCFEHYNPYTGQASVYRGIDDYQHSWVLDLILRGVMGIHPTTTGLTVDPLPMELDHAVVGLRLRGRAVLVERRGDAVRVRLDDCDRETTVGRPVELAW